MLLLDFFANSAAGEAKWRIILELLNDDTLNVPTFDSTKHSIIISELKSLYVACTRARNRLWIWDTSATLGPMKLFLQRKELVTTWTPASGPPKMAVTSGIDEWRRKAKML